MGKHFGYSSPPEIGSHWTIEIGPFTTGYYVTDILTDGTVIMEDEEHEVRILDYPDGNTEVQEITPKGWMTVK